MWRIILIGMKSSGKTVTGKALAKGLGVPFIDLDDRLERRHSEEKRETLGFREIFKKYGADYFRALENAALKSLPADLEGGSFVLSTGGGTPLDEKNRGVLKKLGTVVFLDAEDAVLLPRIIAKGVPAFFPYPDDPGKSLAELMAVRRPAYERAADLSLQCGAETPEALAERIRENVESLNC
ncbi:MAG: hypothetical protein GY859_33290 [Desulfobacterales bacterium]|nr:hypothetical protein [Desulfobacterales bacterium]